ncbi:MFS transporter [Roseobacter sp. HKCCD9010]|uniref:MFS transporter n=1 Tax=unclassified Roseobacter TaxID=196798 RepID=UPI001490EF54|nr:MULTISPECIES: MFS transporter [unclassified Roseobacter]MBF9052145.1 MFS transporter [Rhodobacterales bacterium HKCCD4356]NNV14100.1 MFS transporter [Roseobacter sp. HKCCD7357]NNV18305.1 MFS transporter [Roseobacter sp. HKCCD8768]NNV27764.1 MFS transporter [Roseobacter sp. HKCCD8192]NNV32039.1 MFS transporter [Roseobacter sp. HKCCD9061]
MIGYLPLLRQPRVAAFFANQLLASFGDGLLGVFATIVALRYTSDPGLLGLAAFYVAFPRGVFGLVGGVIADAVGRRSLLIACDLTRAVCVLALAIMAWTSELALWVLLLPVALAATTYGVSKPASKAIIPSLVSEAQLLQTNSLIHGFQWPSYFLGAGVMGGIFAITDSISVSALIVALVFFFATPSLFALPSVPAVNPNLRLGRVWPDLRDSAHTLRGHRLLFLRVTSYFGYTAAWRGMIYVVLPLALIEVFDLPSEMFGALMLASGTAELIAALRLGNRHNQVGTLALAFVAEAVLAAAAAVILMSAVLPLPAFAMAMLAAALVGASAAVADIPIVTTIQTTLDDAHRGRAFSLWNAIGALGGSAGVLLIGALLQICGLSLGLLLLGSGLLGISLWFRSLQPAAYD